jgi:phosphoribosylanthranilate isomerase
VTWVKVCGLTRMVDVAVAVEAGADAVGFVVAPRSPRAVDLGTARRLAAGLAVQAVLVTADLEPAALLAAAEEAEIDGVQTTGRHAPEAAAAARDAGLFVLQAVPVGTSVGGDPVARGVVPLYDSAAAGRVGGTGTPFDWSLVAGLGGDFVIAGGLGPDNVAAAVAAARPFGVDAASRLEAGVGEKDHGKVIAFVQEAKRA